MKFCDNCGSRLKSGGRSTVVCVQCGKTESLGKPSEGSTSLMDYFPYKSLRLRQEAVLREIEVALGSKKFIMFEAPVGFGKSAVAATLCRFLGSAHVVTATKQLQDQYATDFGYPIIKGKSNFQCYVPTSTGQLLPCSKGRCEVDWNLDDCPHYLSFQDYGEHKKKMCDKGSKCEHLKDRNLCTNYDQKWYGFSAPITVHNYSFILSELKYAYDVPGRKLLECDEVHELERQLVEFSSYKLNRGALQYYHDDIKYGEPLVIPYKGLDDPVAWLGVLDSVKELLDEYLEVHKEADHVQDKTAVCKGMLEDLGRFMNSLKAAKTNWVVNNVKVSDDLSVEEVVFKPLNVSSYTSPLFKLADKVLLMSATIFSLERLCNSLGIPQSEVHFIKVEESAFPLENRPLFALNTAYLNKANIDASLESIAKVVDRIMDSHADERGVIHTTSYMQARYISQHVSEQNKKRLVNTEGSFDRSLLLRIHGSNDASVLISPSLYQGVDLKDELSRFQIIVKVPYPDLSERRTRIMLERDQAWYSLQTAQRLVQAYGRSVRSETDHAVTYVLDSNFTRFLSINRKLFPKYFLDALREGELPMGRNLVA